jgi:DNA-binding MarR family transcriptional regulator
MSHKRETDKPEKEKFSAVEGRFCYEGLDRVMHEKARLGILASLAAHAGGLLFNDLKQLCSLTDGNLSRHLTVLSEAGLVETWKGTSGARPQTMYRLTAGGRQRFADYISVLEKVVADAHLKTRTTADQSRLSGGWSHA